MTLEFKVETPVPNILKLGKAFDLETMPTDQYQIILLSNTTGLTLENLDKFDTEMEARESDPANYTRTNIGLQVTRILKGYQIDVVGNNALIPVTTATIAGILIINEDTNDILCADLSFDTITINSDLNLLFSTPIWVIGKQVCEAGA